MATSLRFFSAADVDDAAHRQRVQSLPHAGEKLTAFVSSQIRPVAE
jgi:hypothetical protein